MDLSTMIPSGLNDFIELIIAFFMVVTATSVTVFIQHTITSFIGTVEWNMSEIIKMILPLVGVVVGGLITFFIQQSVIRKQQKWDREKIEIDNFKKGETKKLETYNRILEVDAIYIIHIHDHHTGKGTLKIKNFNQYVRPLLFEIFHLLDEEVANSLNNIEEICERQRVMEDDYPDDYEKLSDNYINIISEIKKQFRQYRESNKRLKNPGETPEF